MTLLRFIVPKLLVVKAFLFLWPCHVLYAEQAYTEPKTGMEFVLIKGGCFHMGDSYGDGDINERPVYEVPGEYRLERGGGWNNGPLGIRNSHRVGLTPTFGHQSLGFRLVLDK